MLPQPRCPHCRHFLYLAALTCPHCGGELGFHILSRSFVVPRESYRSEPVQRLLTDREWMSEAFNRINRSMGFGDRYPFELVAPVKTKLAFVHEIIPRAPLTTQDQIAMALPPAEERP